MSEIVEEVVEEVVLSFPSTTYVQQEEVIETLLQEEGSIALVEEETTNTVLLEDTTDEVVLQEVTEEIVMPMPMPMPMPLREMVEETEEVILDVPTAKPPAINVAEWEAYMALLHTWHKESLDDLKAVLDEHYKIAEKLLHQRNNSELMNQINALTKKIHDPGEFILGVAFDKKVLPKIKQIPASMKELWENGIKQVEYAFSQQVQPILEEYFTKLQNIQKNSKPPPVPAPKGPSKISALASRFEEKPAEPPQKSQQPPVKSTTPASIAPQQSPSPAPAAATRGRGGRRGRGRGRVNKFSGNMGSGDVQKMLSTLSKIADELSDEE